MARNGGALKLHTVTAPWIKNNEFERQLLCGKRINRKCTKKKFWAND